MVSSYWNVNKDSWGQVFTYHQNQPVIHSHEKFCLFIKIISLFLKRDIVFVIHIWFKLYSLKAYYSVIITFSAVH